VQTTALSLNLPQFLSCNDVSLQLGFHLLMQNLKVGKALGHCGKFCNALVQRNVCLIKFFKDSEFRLLHLRRPTKKIGISNEAGITKNTVKGDLPMMYI
jgi:hypothetical protein